MAGGLSQSLGGLRDELLDLLADLEAGLDFGEEDIQFISAGELTQQLETIDSRLDEIRRRMTARSVAPDGARIVLVGCPNVGKSSLLNALIRQPAAIVAEGPGTTRDYLVERLQLPAITCQLIDTAGLNEAASGEAVGTAAQVAALEQLGQSDLQLLCLDATRLLNAWEQSQLAEPAAQPRLAVLTKIDRPRVAELTVPAVETSSLTGQGLDELRARIARQLAEDRAPESHAVAQTAARCGHNLRLAHQGVQRARDLATRQAGDELVAAEVRGALDELGQVVGAVYTEDLLDRIFSRFCIGK